MTANLYALVSKDGRNSVAGEVKHTGQRLLTAHTGTPRPCGNKFLCPTVGSGAGMNMRVGEGTSPAQTAWKIFLVVPLHFFGSKSTISRFGERFRDGLYSLVSLFFAVLLLTVPPTPVPRHF